MTLSIVKAGTPSLPTFVTNPIGQLVFTPVLATITGPYIINMIVTDQWGVSSPTITFTINVTPVEAPLFYLPLSVQTVKYPNTITLTYSLIDSF